MFLKNLKKILTAQFGLSMTKGSGVSWWQFRDGHHSRNFAKINFDFFWTSTKMKECAVSSWQFRDGHKLRNFAKVNFDFFLNAKQHKKAQCYDGNFVIATICEILQKLIATAERVIFQHSKIKLTPFWFRHFVFCKFDFKFEFSDPKNPRMGNFFLF